MRGGSQKHAHKIMFKSFKAIFTPCTRTSHIRIPAILLSIWDINIWCIPFFFPKLRGVWSTSCLNPWLSSHLISSLNMSFNYSLRHSAILMRCVLLLLAFENLRIIFGRGDYRTIMRVVSCCYHMVKGIYCCYYCWNCSSILLVTLRNVVEPAEVQNMNSLMATGNVWRSVSSGLWSLASGMSRNCSFHVHSHVPLVKYRMASITGHVRTTSRKLCFWTSHVGHVGHVGWRPQFKDQGYDNARSIYLGMFS